MKSKQVQKFQETEIGKIPSDWEINKLENLVKKICTGRDPKGGKEAESNIPTDYRIIKSAAVFDGYLNLSKTGYISQEIAKTVKSGEVKEDDVLLNQLGDGITFARSCVVQKDCLPAFVTRSVGVIRVNNEKLDPNFLNAYLVLPKTKQYIESFNSGTSKRAIDGGKMKLFLIPKPPLDEQKIIGKYYADFLKKISILKQINKKLEQIVQAIFTSWFVDFDKETEFEDSELGQIPKKSKIVKVSDFITLDKGISYKGKFLSDTGIPMVNLGNIAKNGGFIDEKIKYYSGEFKTNHIIATGDIVIANTDITQDRLVLGSPAIVPPLNTKDTIFTHHIFAVRNNSSLGNYFLYHLFKTPEYHSNVISYATGTTVLAISRESVLDFQFVLLQNNLVDKFEEIASNARKLIFKNNFQIKNLIKIRDILLPKLMSGEIRV